MRQLLVPAHTTHHVWLEVHFTGADVGQSVMSQRRTGVHILLAHVVPPRAQFLMYHSSAFAPTIRQIR